MSNGEKELFFHYLDSTKDNIYITLITNLFNSIDDKIDALVSAFEKIGYVTCDSSNF